MTSKVILTNVQVLAAGTKIDRDTDKNKPMPVSVVTLLVNPDEAERLTLAAAKERFSSRSAIRSISRRRPRPASDRRRCSVRRRRRSRTGRALRRHAARAVEAAKPVEPITVEIIRGDKRAREIVRQEQ